MVRCAPNSQSLILFPINIKRTIQAKATTFLKLHHTSHINSIQSNNKPQVNMLYAGFYNLKEADNQAQKSAQSSRRTSQESTSSQDSGASHKVKKFLKNALDQLKPLPEDQRVQPVGFFQPIIERGPLFHSRRSSVKSNN